MYDFFKRLIDILGSLFGLILLSPLFFFTAILIKLDSSGPLIFSQERVSKGGKTFRLFKFRSMIENAEEILYKNKKMLKEYEANSYKIPNDPRLTNSGRILRRFSLDELPQLWNVLKGDMSLVGPRAYRSIELQNQQEVYPETKQYAATLLTTKPGITGPWQTSGRSNINFDQRVRMDASYALRRSLVYDFKILVKTIPAVLKGEGAT